MVLALVIVATASSCHPRSPLLRLRGGSAEISASIEKSISADNAGALQSALEEGTIDASSTTQSGNNVLHVACKHGAIACTNALLAQNPLHDGRG